jgi:nicotinamide riboside transporter PnuC
MMRLKQRGSVATLSWAIVIFALAASFIVIVAGLLGFVSAATVSLGSFSAVLLGCIASIVYLISVFGGPHRTWSH